MRFEHPLTQGRLIRRYKRFLADIRLDDGTTVTAHVPNTGSMMSTNEPNSPVALSHHPSPKRKLKWTLELIRAASGAWVGVNTTHPNSVVAEAISQGHVGTLAGYGAIRREVKYGQSSRIDLLLTPEPGAKWTTDCYVEVKNVTYRKGQKARFPDAVTARGTKHLNELMAMVSQGHRAVIFYLVNRSDCLSMAPAGEIDPLYAETLAAAVEHGVEAMAFAAKVSLGGIEIARELKIEIGG